MKNDEAARQGRPDNNDHPPQTLPLRSVPALLVCIELEQPARVVLTTDSYEDEQRLRSWLNRSGIWQEVSEFVDRQAA